MSDLKPYNNGLGAVALRPANPDGKGANGFMLDWYRSEPRGVVAKPKRQVLAEFFTSMLVLSAKFKYKPAEGVSNYLYLVGDDWMLSLIAPEQWSDERRRGFVGTCVLQHDMTWTIDPSERLSEDGPVADAVRRFFDAFAEKMDTDLTLEEILPYCVQKLPYYQRLFANALSRSIRAAVVLGDQTDIPAREWQSLLPGIDNLALLQSS
ncbi:MAG: hypothetical protein QNI99_16605 [Woeseiaceae bacterium]|nr:hypothetical protein [Woeseiaceae bacterium]